MEIRSVLFISGFLSLAPLAVGAAPIWPRRMRGPVKAAALAAPEGAKRLYGERRRGFGSELCRTAQERISE
jgi:hypothetical protein